MKKHKKIDKLALRLTADRVLSGTAPKNSVAYMKKIATKLSRTVKRLEEAQEKESDSAEEGKGLLQTLKESNGGELPSLDFSHHSKYLENIVSSSHDQTV